MDIEKLYSIFLSSQGICTDTRKLQKGCIFFALKGSNFNGNLFAAQALNEGAIAVVVDEQQKFSNDKIILVDDALKTLQQLATYHRCHLTIPYIAIAGSNGKTTTKELIHSVLSTTFNTFATQGNLNNHIGVPLTILSINKDTQMAVIELGANHLLETAFLCDILQPDIGLITNNGKDHLEGYGSLENVKKGNGELFDFLKTNKGTAFVNADDNDLMNASVELKRITYGNKADINGEIISDDPFLKIKWKNHAINTQLFGKYNFANILCAIAIGTYFKISDENICKGIESYVPKNNRSQVVKLNSNTIIVDCYNANPSSMALAIESFAELKTDKKMVILGDMFELGEFSNNEHKEILNFIAQKHFSDVLLIGPEFAKVDTTNTYKHFKTTADLKQWFYEQHFSNYSILLKGSRGMALEKLLT